MSGFITLVGGAWVNACLNRRRDDQLRREERRAVAAALQAELVSWRDRLQSHRDFLTSERDEVPTGTEVLPIKKLLFPETISKIGLLPPATIGSVMAAYDQADWYWSRMRDEAEIWDQARRSGSDAVKSRASEKALSQYDELAEKTREKIERAIADLEPMSGQASPCQLCSITRALDYD